VAEIIRKNAVDKEAELKALKRHGMRWAVLLSLSQDLLNKGVAIPTSVNTELRMSRIMLESGCFSSCDVSCSLDEIERILVPKATAFGKKYLENWLNLLGKAMKMRLTPEEVKNLPFIQPVISDCNFLKCSCDSSGSV